MSQLIFVAINMKLAVILLSLAAYVVADVEYYNTAYGYIKRYGIPAGDRIRAQEEEYLKNPISRIFNGSPATLGQFPYQAGLISAIRGTSGQGVCGGALVTQNRVLTAAHCWFDGVSQAIRFTVVLGSLTLFSGGTRIVSESVVMHDNWTPSRVRNDIAVIHLPSPVTLSNRIATVPYATGNDNYVGREAIASGFGMYGNNVPITNSQSLRYGRSTIITNSQCSTAFPLIIQSSNICTRTQGTSSPCRGDSGGPLTVLTNGVPVLVGLTSFGAHPNRGGCESGLPAAYVRITSYTSFIRNNL